MFDLQGFLNTLFGYPINLMTTPYMNSYNEKIKNVLLKNNCVFTGGGGYNPELMTHEQIVKMEADNAVLANKYTYCRDSLTKENTNNLDKTVHLMDAASGLTMMGTLGFFYYFNKDKISLGKFALGIAALGLGGVAVAKIKNNNNDAAVMKANENIIQKTK